MKSPLRSRILTAAIAATLLFSATAAEAAPGAPAFIDYQGRVLDGNGAPLAPTTPANFEIEFRIYDDSTGPGVIWAEKQLVTVLNGQFSVRLGEGQPITATGGGHEGTVGHMSPGLPGAFADSSRYLGVTVKIPGQTPGEITPRLAFLSAPFAFASTTAGQLVQAPGTQSDLTVGSIAYSSQTLAASAAISGSSRTVLVDGSAGAAGNPITATLPVSGAQKEILIAKTDATDKQIVVAPPAGGNINGISGPVRLKVKGESVTLQNVGGNDWWIVNDNRDKTPPGTIISFGGNGPAPAGYLICDGSILDRADYPDLFAAVGAQWGAPNASAFNVPQLAGRFLRGIDASGNGADDDATTRFALTTGGATGRHVGTYQNEEFRMHSHTGNTGVAGAHSHAVTITAKVSNTQNGANGFNGGALKTTDRDIITTSAPIELSASTSVEGNHSHSLTTNNTGGNETRPDNAGVRFCIKY